MTVEITPSGEAKTIAQQLLAIAETDPRFDVRDVGTTSSGPLGFAFLVPDELHAAWSEAYQPKVDDDEEEAAPKHSRRGRPRKTDTPEE